MIRNFYFQFFFYRNNFHFYYFYSILFLPQKIVLFGGKLMGYWSIFCLKFILSTKITLKGRENIIKDRKFLLLLLINQCLKHFTFKLFLTLLFLFLKKELLNIPIFGWYLKKLAQFQLKEIR